MRRLGLVFSLYLNILSVSGRSFSGKLIGLLIPKLESSNEKIRIGILTIFKHLINAAGKCNNSLHAG